MSEEHTMGITKASAVAAAALAPLASAAIAIAASAPAIADDGADAASPIRLAAAYASDDPQWDGSDPAGGTGIDPGPQTAPDIPGVPESAGIDAAEVGDPAGGTGIDPGFQAPPDTPSGPGLEDGGEPAGGIG